MQHADLAAKIIEYEDGRLSEEDTIAFFQELVNSGLAWTLQGHYGRTAHALINAGLVTLPVEEKPAKVRLATFEREIKRLSDVPGGFDWNYVFFDEEPQQIARDLGYEEADVVTGAAVKVVDGDYAEVWVTTNSKPYLSHAWYVHIEQVRLPEWYHGKVGTNDYVARCWREGLPARSHNRHFHTDGWLLYSYTMKIGRTVDGRKEVLNANGFSPSTTEHVMTALNAYKSGQLQPTQVQPVKAVTAYVTEVGWTRKQYKNYWLYFPGEEPKPQPITEKEYNPGYATDRTRRGTLRLVAVRNPNPPEESNLPTVEDIWYDQADADYEDQRDSNDFE